MMRLVEIDFCKIKMVIEDNVLGLMPAIVCFYFIGIVGLIEGIRMLW